eukprot:COSAG01_NODE_56488_length_318_cov_0.689498_1_plen_64_part_10
MSEAPTPGITLKPSWRQVVIEFSPFVVSVTNSFAVFQQNAVCSGFGNALTGISFCTVMASFCQL